MDRKLDVPQHCGNGRGVGQAHSLDLPEASQRQPPRPPTAAYYGRWITDAAVRLGDGRKSPWMLVVKIRGMVPVQYKQPGIPASKVEWDVRRILPSPAIVGGVGTCVCIAAVVQRGQVKLDFHQAFELRDMEQPRLSACIVKCNQTGSGHSRADRCAATWPAACETGRDQRLYDRNAVRCTCDSDGVRI